MGRDPTQAAEGAGGGVVVMVLFDDFDFVCQEIRHAFEVLGFQEHFPLFTIAQEVESQEDLLGIGIDRLLQPPAVGAQLQILLHRLGHHPVALPVQYHREFPWRKWKSTTMRK